MVELPRLVGKLHRSALLDNWKARIRQINIDEMHSSASFVEATLAKMG
jgi:hypothetical protein